MTGLVHVLAGDQAEVERVVDGQVETVALCGTRWVPTVADPDGPVCGVCVRALIGEVDRRGASRPSLAEQQARYLEVRQHTLSTEGLDLAVALYQQSLYVAGEGEELGDAGDDLAKQVAVTDELPPADSDLMRHVRHEIADVVIAAVTLANLLGVTVEACIAEKTEADRGRG